MDFLADFDHLGRVADEMVGQLADVDQAILMDADVNKGTKGGDVGDDSGEFHAHLQVAGFIDAVLERK